MFVCVGELIVGLVWMVIRSISLPLLGLTGTRNRLAQRDWTAEVQGQDRGDEIGNIATAVAVLRENGIESDRLQQQIEAERRRNEENRVAQEALLDRSIGQVVSAANAGALDQRIDTAALDGVAAKIGQQINTLLDTIDR